jgi:hypothetical protein
MAVGDVVEHRGQRDRVPEIFTSVGTMDPHWDEIVRLRTALIKDGYDVYWERGRFIHDWTNCNHYVDLALQWAAKRWTAVDEQPGW